VAGASLVPATLVRRGTPPSLFRPKSPRLTLSALCGTATRASGTRPRSSPRRAWQRRVARAIPRRERRAAAYGGAQTSLGL